MWMQARLSPCLKQPRVLVTAAAFGASFAVLLCGPPAPAGYAQNRASDELTNGASKIRSIKGRVIDETGGPLAGASVTLEPAGGNRDPGNEGQTVRTDEDGGFSFDAIPDKPYTVSVFGFEDPAAGQYHLPGENITIRVERGGVITGRVTGADGEPLVGIRVIANCIRGKGDRPLGGSAFSYELSRSRLTDDRGVYRFWALQPGIYIVSAGRPGAGLATTYDDDSPTYYPSSTLGSASHIEVNSGQELTGIDIKYRDYTGHAVSGTITGKGPLYVVYLATPGGLYLDSVWVHAAQSSDPFAFARVSDGEYQIIAVGTSGKEIRAISRPSAVIVKGADITGINLSPMPFGSLSGQISLENDPQLDCKNKTTNTLAETVLSLRSAGRKEHYPSFIESQLTYAGSPDAKSKFAIERVPAGDYRIALWLPNEDWYISAITFGSGVGQVDVASKGISITQGKLIFGLNVVMKNGAAGLSGRIVPTVAGTALPRGLRVFLVPAERRRAEERLRFSETEAGSDGSFKFNNFAPGSYRIFARTVQQKDSAEHAADTAAGRAGLLRDAGDKAPMVELHPCERQVDYILK